MKTRNHGLPKADKRGRIRPHVGNRPDGKKARIDVGNVKTEGTDEMKRRLDVIRTLYDRQCERSQIERWNHWALQVARRIGNGEQLTDGFLATMFDSVTVAGVAAQLRAWGISVTTGDIHQQGMQVSQEQIEAIVAKSVQEQVAQLRSVRGVIVDQAVVGDPMTMAETASFYEALDSFGFYMRETGKKDERGKLTNTVYTDLDTLKQIKERIDDFPLRQFLLPKWEAVLAVWKNRPTTKRGNRGSRDWVEDVIKILFRFVRWLDTNPQFKWTMPRGFLDVDRRIISLPQDESSEIFQTISKMTYSPEELATIMRNTDPFWKCIIAVCVNCAFGQSEIGQWSTKRIVFSHAHPHAEKIGWRSKGSDHWACGPRPKTGCYGEHLLWPEVADAIKPLMADGRPVLAVTRTGKPMWMTHAKRPQSQIDNRWKSLMDRITKKTPDFPRLPFGSLRDVLPDIIRQKYSDDVASLALQHKTYSADKLLQCYANFPFAKLFKATEELREHFKPMLDALKEQDN